MGVVIIWGVCFVLSGIVMIGLRPSAQGGYRFIAVIFFVGGVWAIAGASVKPSTAVAIGAFALAIGAIAVLGIASRIIKIAAGITIVASVVVGFLALPVQTQSQLRETGATSAQTGGTVFSLIVGKIGDALDTK